MNYKKLLKSKKFKIAIWGTGYIGLSTMVYFSKEKIKCLGYDIDKQKVKKINSGVIPLADLKNWFGFDINLLAIVCRIAKYPQLFLLLLLRE